MKRMLKILLPLLFLIALPKGAKAFDYDPNAYMQFYYEYCSRSAFYSFAFFQTQGENDRMNYLYLDHKPSTGPVQRVIDFRHQSQWDNGPGQYPVVYNGDTTDFSYNINASPFNFQVTEVSVRFIENYGNTDWDLYFIDFRLQNLPDNFVELFNAHGFWRAQGSNSNDLDINENYTIQLEGPDMPGSPQATMGQCEKVTLTFTNNEHTACPGKTYYWVVFQDGLFAKEEVVPNISATDITIEVPVDPISPDILENQHNYKVRLELRQGNTVIHSSDFAGPAVGGPKPLPAKPQGLMVNYPNCSGDINMTWQNIGNYDSVRVDLVPNTGPTISATLSGSTTTFSTAIQSGKVYSATVTAIDVCDAMAESDPLGGIAVPQGPGMFDLDTVYLQNGKVKVDWSPSAGADSYTITRQSSEGTKTINIPNPMTTIYTDTDIRVCIQYSYSVAANNNCGTVETETLNAPVVQPAVNVWSNQKITGSKGYFVNRVELAWDAPNSYAFDHFKMYRKVAGTAGLGQFLQTIDKNSLAFTDVFAQAGVIYEYSLVAYNECNGNFSESQPITDIGFRLPIAIVNGNVKFEAGNGVEGVTISVENNNGPVGKSLQFTGSGKVRINNTYQSDPLAALPISPQMAVELWLRPTDLSQDFTVFDKVVNNTSYGLRYDAAANQLVQFFDNGSFSQEKRYPVAFDTNVFAHIAWVRNQSNLSLYINGEAPQNPTTAAYTAPGGQHTLWFGNGFTGYMDEIRFWNTGRSQEDIQADFNRVLAGDEDGLIGFWRAEEGIHIGVYDNSGMEGAFNGNHMFMDGAISWANVFPTGTQLRYFSMTDSVGNYTVRNIRYTGNGNTFNVVPYFSPGGTPHQFDPASTVLFLGEGNDVQNGVNFIDNSAFRVTGSIRYSMEDSDCDNTGAFIYIDDRIATVNGEPARVDPMTKTFDISVPIGLHRLKVVQAGHVFKYEGKWPQDGTQWDFQDDVSGVEFYDSTSVRVIGRVVGGTREGDKKVGFGLSNNNVGKAVITFTSQTFNCHEVTVETDSASGEYFVDLLPVKYMVSVDLVNNTDFATMHPDVLDLTIIRPTTYEVDTTYNFAGQITSVDSVPYAVKQNYIFRSQPDLDVVRFEDMGPLEGDSVYVHIDPETRDSTVIDLDPLPFPAFVAGKRYKTIVSAFEPYVNYDTGEPAEDRVPVTDGTFTIRNGLGNAKGTGQEFDEVIQLRSQDGDTAYTFIGGQPEFIPNANQSAIFNFTKTFEISLETPDHTASWMPNGVLYRGYVFGSKPIEGSSFITEGPEVVDYILRDPPGSGSHASFSTEESYSSSKSWFTTTNLSFGTKTKLRAGTQWFVGGGVVGIGFDSDIKNDNNLTLDLGTSIDINGNYVETTSFKEEISTSSQSNLTGGQMDLFMGKSQNYLFGASEELSLVNTDLCPVIDTCIGPTLTANGKSFRLGKRKGLFIVPQGFKTTFVYSVYNIENVLIPNLENLRNNLFSEQPAVYTSYLASSDPGFGLNNDDPFWGDDKTSDDPISTVQADYDGPSYKYTVPPGEIPDDRIRWYNQQIRLWKEAMARNEAEKLSAKTKRNISFDAGAAVSYSATSSNSETYSEKFEVSVKTTADLFVGAIIGGSGGEFVFTLGLEVVTGAAFSQTSQSSNTYSYTLADGDTGDFFSIDEKNGGKGNGPIFSLRGGQSMCPWERGEETKYHEPLGTPLSESTIAREAPELDVEPSFADNVPAHQPARYTLKLRNASPTGDIQWYGLRVLEGTNEEGAKLSIDGASPNRVFEIPAGTTLEKQLLLTKDDEDFYEIKLVLYSTCEYSAFQNGGEIFAADTITISAQFVPACSPVSILAPNNQWILNVDDQDVLPIEVGDYDISDPGLERIQLQYKPSFTSVWTGLETFWVTVPPNSDDPQIPPASSVFLYDWDVSELPDGPYDIRAVSVCSNTDNDYASPPISGLMDRVRPHAFGNPQPADGVLDPNDEILIQFNEVINPASFSTSDIDLRAVLNGSELRHQTSVQLDGGNDFVEVPVGTRLGAQPFTIEVWTQRLSNGAGLLWSQGEAVDSSMAIGFNSTNELYFRLHNTTESSETPVVADGQWHHIAVTCSSEGLITFYINGSAVGNIGSVDALLSIPGNMAIGKTAWGNEGNYHGYLHEFRIWRTELTIGTIQTQLLKKLSGNEAGLLTLWPMDEGTGTEVRDIVRKKNATLHGDWAILPSGSSLVFGGADYLDVFAGTMVFTDQHNFSMEFWMKGQKTGSPQTLISNGKGDGTDLIQGTWSITANPDGKLMVVHGGQMFSVIKADILNDEWNHIALVMNRLGNLNAYLNGQLQSSTFGTAFGELSGPALWIGSRGWVDGVVEMHDQYFTGAMDEVRIWNTRLTAEMIRAAMNSRLAEDEFGLMFYLPFENYVEMGGVPELVDDLVDHSGFDRDITIFGSPMHQAEDPNIRLQPPFEKVNFTYAVNGDKILITPTTDPVRIENTILYIAVKDVQDLHGNEMASPVTWTAYVNKNQLQWEDSELVFEKPEKLPLEFTANIVNSGGIELGFEILNLPDWLTATPAVGTIGAVSEKVIQFAIDPALPIGEYTTDVNLLSGQGFNDKLIIDVSVFGVPPQWEIDPADFKYSMNIVADLDILGELSDDPLDRVVAYVEGEVRGLANLVYEPQLDRHLGFLEIYSNVTSGEDVTFKVWDAGTGTTYASVLLKVGPDEELFTPFVADALIGDPVFPARWVVTPDIIQEIPINAGWTWISFNVLSAEFDDLDAFFDELQFEDGDEVHSQNKVSTYNPSSGWQGNLSSIGLDIEKMYKCNFTYADVLRVVGPRVDPNDYPISISAGWNWIPYLSRERIEINEALSSYDATPGDQIKYQDAFSVFHPTLGWIGTLQVLEPGKGYMLYAATNGSIVYPLYGLTPAPEKDIAQTHAIKWRSGDTPDAIPAQRKNMTLVAQVESEIPLSLAPNIGAMTNGLLHQVQKGIQIDEKEQPLYFFTLQGDAAMYDKVTFEVYDGAGKFVGIADEQLIWNADARIGTVDEPFVLHIRQAEDRIVEVFPNPFRASIAISLETSSAGEVTLMLYDMQGRLTGQKEVVVSRAGIHRLTWDNLDCSLAPGSYLLKVATDKLALSRMLFKQ